MCGEHGVVEAGGGSGGLGSVKVFAEAVDSPARERSPDLLGAAESRAPPLLGGAASPHSHRGFIWGGPFQEEWWEA